MATVQRLPSGMYRARTSTTPRKSFTAPTKAEALRLALEYENKQGRNEIPVKTVGDMIDEYIDLKAGVLSPTTIHEYRKMDRRFDSIRMINIQDLNSQVVQLWVSEMSARMSPKTVRNTYGLFSSALNFFHGPKLYVTLPAKIPTRYHVPTDADVKKLIDDAEPELRKAIMLAAFGTLRRGEVCALRYEDLTPEGAYVHADIVYDGENWIYKDSGKTPGSTRFVPLPESLLKELGTGTGYVVKYGTPATLDRKWRTLRNKHGFQCRFHDLRHYAASIMHALGIPDQYIMQFGGWKGDAVLKGVYRNTLDDQAKRFADIAGKHFDDLNG